MKHLVLIALSAWPMLGMACNVPVFRYALERWRPSAYEVVVLHQGALSPADRETAEMLNKASEAGPGAGNFTFLAVDLNSLNAAENQGRSFSSLVFQVQSNGQSLAGRGSASLPWMVVLEPQSQPSLPPVWVAHFDKESALQLMNSTLREEMVQRLLRGDSAVWLLLESGNSTADQSAGQMLETELKGAEKSLELPVPDPSDPQMRSTVPLRLAFSILRIAANDPGETFLLALIRHYAAGLGAPAGPVAIPVFGRGRALGILAGAHLQPPIIRNACRFITGACSCQVKEQNPGFDLLTTTDWEGALAKTGNEDMPPLIGLSQGIAPSLVPVAALSSAALPSTNPASQGLSRNLFVVLALGLTTAVLGTFYLKIGNHPR